MLLTSHRAKNDKYLPAEKTKGASCLEQSQNQYLGNLSLYLDLAKQFCSFQSLGAWQNKDRTHPGVPLQFEALQKGNTQHPESRGATGTRSPPTAASPTRLQNPTGFPLRNGGTDGSFGKGRGESRQGKGNHQNDLQLTLPCQHQSQAQQHLHPILKRTAEVIRASVFLGAGRHQLATQPNPKVQNRLLSVLQRGTRALLSR